MKKNIIGAFLISTLWCYGQNTEKIAKTALNSTVSIAMTNYAYATKIQGSGFVVSENIIATNYHVVALGNVGYIQKSQTDTTHLPIKRIINFDVENDLALVEVENLQLPALAITTAELNIGEKIYVSGNPLGLTGTFSDGIVSANRKIKNVQAIQITAPISNGSSGGPVLNSDGKVVGVVFSSYRGGQNLNFVVPSENLLRLLTKPKIEIPLTKPVSQELVWKDLLFEKFNTAKSKHIKSLSLSKGKMTVLDTKKDYYVYNTGENLQPYYDFELKARLKADVDKQTCSFWGNMTNESEDFTNGVDYYRSRKYFVFCLKSGKASLGMYINDEFVKVSEDVPLVNAKNGDFNTFDIRKKGDSLVFKVNDELAFVQKYEYLGLNLGMGAEELSGKITLDYVSMKQLLPKTKDFLITDSTSKAIDLGESVNTPSDECAPFVSLDGETLYFTRYNHPQNLGKGKTKQPDIYTIKLSDVGNKKIKANNKHGFNDDNSNYCIGISNDGSTIFTENLPEEDFGRIRRSAYLFGYSTVSNKSTPVFPIKNYFSYDQYASFNISNEHDVVIASLERPDTFGKSDLYISKKGKDGNWSEMKNMGPVINGLYEEHSAFITLDRKHIIFTSASHSGYGLLDLFISERQDTSWLCWSEPINLGPIINTKGNESSPFISIKTGELFFERSDTSKNISDIFKIKLNNTLSEGYTLVNLKFPQKNMDVHIDSQGNNFEDKFKLVDRDWTYFLFNNGWEYKIKYTNEKGETKEYTKPTSESIIFQEAKLTLD